MEVDGSEIGHKMRSAIKAKLTELGCYVDDELPDYVMVMVANKRTRAQMEDDLQLFLGDNTELFVNWLHQVLKKLQEVTVAAPKPAEPENVEETERSHSKDRKSKDKKSKNKSKKSDLKKAKKKDKEKLLRKKELKKAHKNKSKDQKMIRPNIPPLLMNMEAEPSITDVFAGQILKNHGILIENFTEDPKETKPEAQVLETKRPIVPIIDPSTIQATPTASTETDAAPRDKQLNEIEAKIQGLRQKLVDQLDSLSEDEDFLTIRTEAEELMNDFAEDVFQWEQEQQGQAAEVDNDEQESPSANELVNMADKFAGSESDLADMEEWLHFDTNDLRLQIQTYAEIAAFAMEEEQDNIGDHKEIEVAEGQEQSVSSHSVALMCLADAVESIEPECDRAQLIGTQRMRDFVVQNLESIMSKLVGSRF